MDGREAAAAVVPPFVSDPPHGRVVFGDGALHRVPEEAARLGLRRVLFLHSGRDAEAAGAVRRGLGERLVGEFTGVRPHVPVEVADAARRAAMDAGADGLLCLGGGSATGTAKAVALRTGLPIIAVPTTYAGSEVTAVWGITEAGRKRTGTDPRVRPAVVVYDPELTAALPAALSAVSGLNALAHAVEAFWAPGRTPVTALFAAEAVRLLGAGLPAVAAPAVTPPASTGPTAAAGRGVRSARSVTLFGAYLAGAAFAVAGSGLHHKICHVLGGTWDLPHAPTHAVVLPYVLAWNASRCPAAVRAVVTGLGAGLGAGVGAGLGAGLGAGMQAGVGAGVGAGREAGVGAGRGGGEVSPRGAVEALVALARRVGAPASLARLGLAEAAIPRAAALVAPAVPADNPRPVDEPALAVLLAAAWAGTDPTELIDTADST